MRTYANRKDVNRSSPTRLQTRGRFPFTRPHLMCSTIPGTQPTVSAFGTREIFMEG